MCGCVGMLFICMYVYLKYYILLYIHIQLPIHPPPMIHQVSMTRSLYYLAGEGALEEARGDGEGHARAALGALVRLFESMLDW